MPYTVSSFLQRNNGEHASKGPCQAGFSQSFYSVLISRDVLQGQGVLKGKTFNWPVSPFSVSLGRLNSVGERAPSQRGGSLGEGVTGILPTPCHASHFPIRDVALLQSLKRFTVESFYFGKWICVV